jgi:NADH:ubiquinone oxidoreductase subunit 6 (subunit J)
VNAFHVIGAILALWALAVSFLGVTRENWPGSKRTERAVATISVVLVVGTIGSAIVTSIMHDEEEQEGGEEAALLLPR